MAEFSPKFKEALSLVQKPGRYTGGEPGSVYKDKDKVDVRMAFCFPDTYEIGMSFLGEKILYDILNRHENWWCERAFMPWTDMKEQMERLDIPLYCLESKDPLTDFDIIGFSLEYELCYTNILAMLRLSNIPLRAADRDGSWPLIIAGGPCVWISSTSCSWVRVSRCCRTSVPPWSRAKNRGGRKNSCCWKWLRSPASTSRLSTM